MKVVTAALIAALLTLIALFAQGLTQAIIELAAFAVLLYAVWLKKSTGKFRGQ